MSLGSSSSNERTKSPRGYHVLAEVNTAPAVTYLTRIRNREASSA